MIKNKSWIPKLKIISVNGMFREQILRVVNEHNIAIDLETAEVSEHDSSLIIISDRILSDEEEAVAEYVMLILASKSCIVANTQKRTVMYQYGLRESELANKLENISLKIMSNNQHNKVVMDISKKLLDSEKIINDFESSIEKTNFAQKMIMKPSQNLDDFETYTLYEPYRSVSGDVLFVKQLYNKVFIMIADVTDHGYFAGVYGATLYALANNYIMNSSLMEQNVDMWAHFMMNAAGMFYPENTRKNDSIRDLFSASATFAVIDKSNCNIEFCFCGSGTEPPVIISQGKTAKAVKIDTTNGIGTPLGNGNVLGKVNKKRFFPGDSVLFYTDGATEIFLNTDDEDQKDAEKIYSSENIVKSVAESLNKCKTKPNEIVESIIGDASAYSISTDISKNKSIPNISDDITIFCINWRL